MPTPAIIVDGLSKQYHIGARQNGRKTFREALTEAAAAPFRRLRAFGRSSHREEDTIWALKDVSFDVQPGEVVGIIGRNGAGKSTLLKILTRITEPTDGRAVLNGRVSSLLEVGTGFHLELTGRENIYLSGAVLGMKKREIDRKFDEIVDFSGVEKFIDTPVKRYSSGMTVRLGFAVAAHLEPEVLLVDEVLAVGDAEFQKKCLGKMESVAHGGRTVLFVSHNMGAVQSLCPRAILLRDGQLSLNGPSGDVVEDYLACLIQATGNPFQDNPERSGTGEVRLTAARALNEWNRPARSLIAGRPATLEFRYENRLAEKHAHLALTIFNQLGAAVTNLNMRLTGFSADPLGSEGTFSCHIPNLPFPTGHYRVAVAVQVHGMTTDFVPNALLFEVDSTVFYESGRTPDIRHCACMLQHQWRHEASQSSGAPSSPLKDSLGIRQKPTSP
jgi:lipopolysaccharide transport system ATP-binding protein